MIRDVGERFERTNDRGRVARRAWSTDRDAFFVAIAPMNRYADLNPQDFTWGPIPNPEPTDAAATRAHETTAAICGHGL